MVKSKLKINLFDLIVSVLLLLVVFVVVFAYKNEPNLGSRPLLVVVQVKDDEAIERVMSELDYTDEVYFNSSKYPINQKGYWLVDDEDGGKDLLITLAGMGDIKESDSIFNGQRVFINQKIELRSDYFIQGYVVEYKYE